MRDRSLPLCFTLSFLLDGVTGNTSEFESDILSSNLSPATKKVRSAKEKLLNSVVRVVNVLRSLSVSLSHYGGCSLSGKAPDCASGEQGSNPAAHPRRKG